MKHTFQTTKKERFAYCLFFLGQNILWGYAGYVETFLTDIGIAAATAAMILLVPKLWDALCRLMGKEYLLEDPDLDSSGKRTPMTSPTPGFT